MKGSSARTFALFVVLLGVVASLAPASATTGIGGVDAGKATALGIMVGVAASLCIYGLITGCIDYFSNHKNIPKAIIEFIGCILFGLLAANMSQVAALFGFTAATM